MLFGRRGGERRRLTLSKREHRARGTRHRRLGHGTRPSLGPEARARLVLTGVLRLRGEPKGIALGGIAAGQTAQAGGTSTGVVEGGRRAARRASPLRKERRVASEKEGGRGHRPCEDRGPRFGCPHVDESKLQKSSGGVWPRISSANALQKERQGRVNAGLALGEGRRVKPSFGVGSERYVGVPVSPE